MILAQEKLYNNHIEHNMIFTACSFIHDNKQKMLLFSFSYDINKMESMIVQWRRWFPTPDYFIWMKVFSYDSLLNSVLSPADSVAISYWLLYNIAQNYLLSNVAIFDIPTVQ